MNDSPRDGDIRPPSPKTMRLDINGLRAWAVVAVVLYHFGVPGFSGGYIGVDVFFVISGYLMTRIIVDGLASQTAVRPFSILGFYLSRAGRIIPALATLCAALLVAGYLALVPQDYTLLATHTITTLLFLSNYKFWLESGYFDTASHDKWLLHTWSLSVEWQFYVLFPLLLFFLWRLGGRKSTLKYSIFAILAISLTSSLVTTTSNPSTAFFHLHTRAWELLAGGLVYFLPGGILRTNAQRVIVESLGFTLISAAILGFDDSTSWPGWRAMIPVLGAALVLASDRSASPWTRSGLAQWIGTRSYSIYLWHWPIAVGFRYGQWNHSEWFVPLALLLTAIFSQVSYATIELPGRRALSRMPRLGATLPPIIVVSLLAVLALLVRNAEGFPERAPTAVSVAAKEATNRNPRWAQCLARGGTASPSCVYGGPKLGAIVLGDSHAAALVTAIASAAPSKELGVLEWSYISCPTLLGIRPAISKKFPPDYRCADFLLWALQQSEALPADIPLIIINRTTVYALGHTEAWEGTANTPLVYFDRPHATPDEEFLREFSDRLVSTACRFATRRPVYLLRPIPELSIDIPTALSRSQMLGANRELSLSLDAYHARHRQVWAAQDRASIACGVKIIDPLPYLCSGNRCAAESNGRPLYFDDDHLSEFGNRRLAPVFAPIFTH